MIKNKRVVITGVGLLCSLGKDKKEICENIHSARTNIELEKAYFDNQYLTSFYKHKIKNFNIRKVGIDSARLLEMIEWKEGEEINDLYFLIASIKLALDDSRIKYKNEDNVGLVITHENPGLEPFLSKIISNSFEILKNNKTISKVDFFKKIYELCDRSAYDLQTFMFLFHIAKLFNIHGFSLYINNACASGLFALETASQIIKSGKNKIVIVAGSDCPGVYKYLWLNEIGLYAKDGKIKPFAKNRNGFIFGDGGAALILEDLEYATKRNAHIYAEYLGGGFSLESWKVTVPNISQNFYRDAIIKSLKQSRIKPKEIDLINAHGAGTNIIDQYEAKAMTDIFGKNFKKPFITAFKPYVGHNLGGCALLESAMLLFLLGNNFIPPVLNCDEVDPKLKINIVRKEIYSNKISIALKLSCGFGGYDGAVIFRKEI
ncbi:MAG: beta-ketoacyl synthase N-terminal-like domain-containing protein [Candidatus Omnitrophota bacterium]|nr:beta-ketoacyl synthase N-terminal-like domain-containing protein [Candidatus Omnitrophota bacterium]